MTRLLPIAQGTDVVSLTIEVDGEALPDRIGIVHAEIVRQVNRIPFARLRIADGDPSAADFPASAEPFFVPGAAITMSAGYHGETAPVFSGQVVRQRLGLRAGVSWLEVDCRDVAAKLTLSRRHRHFEDVTDGDAIAEILGDYELEGALADTAATHGQLLQFQCTDWDFIVARLEANGQFAAVEDGVLRSFVPALDPEATAEALFGTNLLELDAEMDSRAQTGSVTARAWDPVEQSLQEIEATEPDWSLPGDLTPEDMVAATGREADQVWHGGAPGGDALQAWADGALLRQRLAGARGRARFQGLGSLALGQTLMLSGLGARFSGGVLVTGLRHLFARNDWTTDAEFGTPAEFHAERFAVSAPPAGALGPAVSGLQVGIVTATAGDPSGEHRVRIKIPVAGFDEDGIWARLASFDAGPERGGFFRPEVDDEVVVGFFHDDPAFPVILGALHSSALAPPEEPSDDNHLKGLVTREGLRLAFDDGNGAITLSTPEGNSLVLSDGDGGITLTDQNGNTIAMTSDGIALTSAGAITAVADGDLGLEGTNAELKASAELKAEGGASAALSSSGMLEIAGAIVMIN